MNAIPFYKMSGAGNDFIIIDNTDHIVRVADLAGFAAKVCRRRVSVGADGLFLLEKSQKADFKWRFFNADGSIAEMCGNGARCVARFAFLTGMTGETLCFETLAGIIGAKVMGDRVKVKMIDPHSLETNKRLKLKNATVNCDSINTGVPHAVIEVDDIDSVDVVGLGREIRHHPDFAPAGVNVNFISRRQDNTAFIRTYERGVEDETLACGTGNTAAALIMAHRYRLPSPVCLTARSGFQLKIYFEYTGGAYHTVYLEGDARVIYKAELQPDSWRY